MSLSLEEKHLIDNLIKNFYSNRSNLEIVENILTFKVSESISLRVLDHFPNNFARVNNTMINGVRIYSDYKNTLKGYQKKQFDPFCRGRSIKLYKADLSYEVYDGPPTSEKVTDEYIITTLRQLNFFKWCIERNIIEYVEKNIDAIKASIRNKDSKKKIKNGTVTRVVSGQTVTF
jgi:hypothetical protein